MWIIHGTLLLWIIITICLALIVNNSKIIEMTMAIGLALIQHQLRLSLCCATDKQNTCSRAAYTITRDGPFFKLDQRSIMYQKCIEKNHFGNVTYVTHCSKSHYSYSHNYSGSYVDFKLFLNWVKRIGAASRVGVCKIIRKEPDCCSQNIF